MIDYFGGVAARNGNSFATTSLSAAIGWSTAHVLDVNFSNQWLCESGEIPLQCEYRIVKPAIAIIMLGTNDVTWMEGQRFFTNLSAIVDVSAENGVIPVLCTIPPRAGLSEKVDEFNRLIVTVTREKSVPLCDYGRWMRGVPNGGISSDGVHPSVPPGGLNQVVAFTPENLSYGYTLRNLVTLHVLDALWQQVIQSG